MLAHPVEQGWVDDPGQIELVQGLTAETVAERDCCALLGSIDAMRLVERFAVVTDIALVSWHTGAIALRTTARPDEVDNVPVALDGVSRTAEALARATINHFYGITIESWTREESEGAALLLEDAAALRTPVEGQEHLGDLVRAWFILTSFPLATHVLVAPKAMIEREADAVRNLVERLEAIRTVAEDRRRELRRNLASQFELDRDRLVEFQSEQTGALSKTARKGWLDLSRRVARAMKLPSTDPLSFVTIGVEPD
jgi:predicted solute-binding protein